MSAPRNPLILGLCFGSILLLSGSSLAQETTPASPTPMTPARERANEVHQAFAEVARQVLPSVVTVRAFARTVAVPVDAAEAAKGEKNPADGGWQVAGEQTEDYPGFHLLSAGSGFVVDAKGEVLTCLNALKKPDGSFPDLLDVEAHDGSRMIAEIVGSEPTVNLAIVQCTVFPTGKSQLEPLRFGDSDAMETGHWVLGFGDPSGPDKFMSVGTFIARPTRDCYQDYLSAFFLQGE
jgi:S1-C subfamily serine protease